MTKEERQKKSGDKVKAVEMLLRQLNLAVEAKQVITAEGMIEMVVFYRDNEIYPEEVKKAPVVEEKKNV